MCVEDLHDKDSMTINSKRERERDEHGRRGREGRMTFVVETRQKNQTQEKLKESLASLLKVNTKTQERRLQFKKTFKHC